MKTKKEPNTFKEEVEAMGKKHEELAPQEAEQLEVAIAALKAVLPDNDDPVFEGLCDKDGRQIKEEE